MDNTLSPIRDYGNYLQHASPLAMGAGQIDPNRALDPGLIYDASPQDYVNLFLLSEFNQRTKSRLLQNQMAAIAQIHVMILITQHSLLCMVVTN